MPICALSSRRCACRYSRSPAIMMRANRCGRRSSGTGTCLGRASSTTRSRTTRCASSRSILWCLARAAGPLCSERLRWLDRILSEAQDRPTLVLMHHPPFLTGISHMDRLGLDGRAAFAEIVRRHPQVERIACGHLHRPIESRFAGTVAGTAPSTAHQIVLDLRPDARVSFAFEPPGYQLHYWREEAGLVTHTVSDRAIGLDRISTDAASRGATSRAALEHKPSGAAVRGRVPAWRRSALWPRPARPRRRLETSACRSAPTPRPSARSCAFVQAG